MMSGTFDPASAAIGAAASPSAVAGYPSWWPTNAQGAPFDLSRTLGQIGGILSGPGTSAAAANPYALRIGGQGNAWSPGNAGLSSLLTTIMQMHRNAAIAQQPVLQPLRASLLG